MNEKVYKLCIQIAVLACILYLAKIGMFEKESLNLIFGTIAGYAFATAKEAYINKDNNENK